VLANLGGDSAERVSQAILAPVWPKLRAPAPK
jgi:hypothetical protein